MRLQFAFVLTKPNLTPWPLCSSSSLQNTGQWQDLHRSDLSIAPFSKSISTTMLFLFSARSSESISEQSFRAETLAFDSSSSSHFTWSNHDPLSDCASVVFLCSQILFAVFLCFFRFRVLVQGQSDFRFIGFIFRRYDCRECGSVCTPARALEIRHLSVLSRNRQELSITFRAQLMAGNRKGSF